MQFIFWSGLKFSMVLILCQLPLIGIGCVGPCLEKDSEIVSCGKAAVTIIRRPQGSTCPSSVLLPDGALCANFAPQEPMRWRGLVVPWGVSENQE